MTRQSRLKAEILTEARRLGVDLVGVAAVDSLNEAPPSHKPTDIMPKAKSVIVLARKCLAGPMNSRHWTSYTAVHDGNIARLDNDAYHLARYIEENSGADSLPIPAMTPYSHWDEARQYAAGDLSHKHAAVAAGLGVLGKNSLLITPQYGNRVNLVCVITELAIEPDPVLGEELCPPDCRLCIESCPVGAIGDSGRVDQQACRSHCWTKLPRGFSVLQCWECRGCCLANKMVQPACSSSLAQPTFSC
ncbi:MAG: epoxyqueuosine reductase [Negativicutes bacterium]|nr:epoxyqueuosine reductase [Negativicutes bacterium]